MSRFESKNVKLGEAFRVGENQDNIKKSQIEKEAEIIISTAREKAESILNVAKSDRDDILRKAQEDARKILDGAGAKVEEAIQQGTQNGIQMGLQQITNDLQEKVLMIDEFTKVNFEIKKKIIKSAQLDIINLITEIARKIALDNINDTKFLSNLVAAGIEQLPEKEFVTVMINPKLAAKIYEISPGLKEKIRQLQNIKIVEDVSVTPDGPIVEGVGVKVDARVSTQINVFENKLKEHLNSIPEEDLVKMSEEDIQEPISNKIIQEPIPNEIPQELNAEILQEPIIQEPIVQEPIIQEPMPNEIPPELNEEILQEPMPNEISQENGGEETGESDSDETV